MKIKFHKKYSIMLGAAALASIVLAISMMLTLYYNYDAVTQLTDGVMHTVIMALIAPVLAGIGVAWAFMLRKKTIVNHVDEGKKSLLSTISYLAVAAVSAVLTISYMLASYSDPLKDLLNQPSSTPYYSNIISVVLAFCVALVMVFMPFSKKGPYSPVRLLPLLGFAVFYGIRLHTDMNYLLMNTRRMISVLAVCMILLFITAKIRVLCYKCAQTFYIISGTMAVGSLAVSGFSGVMLNILGAARDGIQFWFYALELVLAIYVFAELFKYSYDEQKVEK